MVLYGIILCMKCYKMRNKQISQVKSEADEKATCTDVLPWSPSSGNKTMNEMCFVLITYTVRTPFRKCHAVAIDKFCRRDPECVSRRFRKIHLLNYFSPFAPTTFEAKFLPCFLLPLLLTTNLAWHRLERHAGTSYFFAIPINQSRCFSKRKCGAFMGKNITRMLAE